MNRVANFELFKWIEGNKDSVSIVLGGSAAPPLSIEELETISTDPQATTKACDIRNLKFGLGSVRGAEALRERVAAFYTHSESGIVADDVIIANATTGTNLMIQEALISPSDHVICIYPTYGPLFAVPIALGAQISYWRLDPDKCWNASIDELKALIRPSTRLLIVNNPHNPTGSVLSTADQVEIVKVAKEHKIVIMADEIFRPLFYKDERPSSFVEHSNLYDRIVVTGSLSKAWGLSGLRIGWCVTKNEELRKLFINMREYVVQSTSVVDEIIATEVLSERCRDQILARNLTTAETNLKVLSALVERQSDILSCVLPAGGATAFLQFRNRASRLPLDDLLLCRVFMKEIDVMLSPGNLCFGHVTAGDFRGFVRVHLTAPCEMFMAGMQRIEDFVRSVAYDLLT